MGIWSNIRNKVAGRYEAGTNYELGQSLSSTAVSSLFGHGGDKVNVLEEYAGIAWKCIDIRAERLSVQDMFVERLVASKWQEDKQHEFNKVLEGGEGETDQSEILEAHEKSMCLFGESFWYFSKGETLSKPFAVYLLNPNSMTVLIANHKVTGYVFQEGTQRIAFDPEEIAHFKIHDWRHPYRGTGPMQAAGWFIRSSRYTMTFINNFMENNAIPAGVIVAEDNVSDPDWELFKQQWTEKYSGVDKAGKTGFLRNSKVHFEKTGLSLGEIDFEKIKNSNREDIMVMFGISKPMMAIFDDINRASAVTAERLFAQSITAPSLRRIKRKISKKVVAWYGDQFQLGSTNPVPEDDEVKITRLEKGTNKWITVNEARAADGLEPLGPEYDKIVVPQTNATTPPADPPAKSLGKITIRTKNNKAEFGYEMKESFRSEMENIQVKYEKQFFQKSNSVLAEQKAMVIDQLQPKKLVAASFDPEGESKKLADQVLPLFMLLAEEQGTLSAQFAGNTDTEFKLTDVMKTYIRNSVAKSALSFSTETQEKIATAIADGLTAGEAAKKIAKRIDVIYEDLLGVKTPGFRTERLARTEIIKASNEITEAAYKQTGIVEKKEWFANPGCCQFCSALNGSIIRLGGTFVPKGATMEGSNGGTRLNDYEDVMHPPTHSSCRCTLIPVLEAAS